MSGGWGGGAGNPLVLGEIADPDALADSGKIYVNDVGGISELMYKDSAGSEVQLTNAGSINAPTAAITAESGDTTQVAFFDAATTLSGEATFTWTAASDTLTVAGIITGSDAVPLTIIGGAGATDDLILRATSHATDGDIIFETDSTPVEFMRILGASQQLVIGRATATDSTMKVEVEGTTNGSFYIVNRNLSTGTSAEAGIRLINDVGGTGVGGRVTFTQLSTTSAEGAGYALLLTNNTGGLRIGTGTAHPFDVWTNNLRRGGVNSSGVWLFGNIAQIGGEVAQFGSGAGNVADDVYVNNTNTGTIAQARLICRAATNLVLGSSSSGFTTASGVAASRGYMRTTGVMLLTTDGANAIEIQTNQLRRATFGGAGYLLIGPGTGTPSQMLELEETETITGAVTDGYAGAFRLDPGYTAATALTVTRHNYIDIQDVSVAGAGPAAVTDACVLRFDGAAGTHKATVGATTKTTPGGGDAWVKINMNGTVLYIPAYTSTTA